MSKTKIHPGMMVGISALIIGVCAPGVSLYEAKLMREEQRAAVIPMMEPGRSYDTSASDPSKNRLALLAQNVGIGPARVLDFNVDPLDVLSGFMSVHHRAVAAVFLLVLPIVAAAQAPEQVEAVSNRAIVRQINVTGTVTSPRTAVLSTAVAGLVAELTIDEGHRVTRGEALLKLDFELAQLALERALAELRQRETAVADARRRFAEAEEVGTQRGIARKQIESLRAEVASDEAALVNRGRTAA